MQSLHQKKKKKQEKIANKALKENFHVIKEKLWGKAGKDEPSNSVFSDLEQVVASICVYPAAK